MDKVLYCFMGVTAVMDLIKREIPGWMFWVFGIAGAVGRIGVAVTCGGGGIAGEMELWPELVGIAGSMAVGVLILVISRTVQGAVGEGDGWFFVVSGLYVSWKINMGLLCYGLMLCCIYGILLTFWGTVKGVSVRKKKIPFLPFISLAGILMLACRLWQ